MPNDEEETEERPCLHCEIMDLIENYFAEYPVQSDEPEAVDVDEIVTALAKTVAELTCGQDAAGRQKLIEQLMREVAQYDDEFRQQDALGTSSSGARH